RCARRPRRVASSHGAYGRSLRCSAVTSAVAIVALPATAVAIWLLLGSPLARRLVALPSEDRWHDTPTPLLGGLGIFAGFSVGFWLAAAAGAFDVDQAIVGIYAAIALVFAAGLADDLYGLPPLAKLPAQLRAAVILLASGTHVQLIDNRLIGDVVAIGGPVRPHNGVNPP